MSCGQGGNNTGGKPPTIKTEDLGRLPISPALRRKILNGEVMAVYVLTAKEVEQTEESIAEPIVSFQSNPLPFYSRKWKDETQSYIATVGNHANTVRWQYEVPADKRALVCSCITSVSAVPNAGDAQSTVQLTTKNTAVPNVLTLKLSTGETYQSADLSESLALNLWLEEGERIRGQTKNDGANNITFRVDAVIREFSADGKGLST